MLYPTAGSRLFMADTTAAPGSVAAGAWVEIGETEALGAIGGQWKMIEVNSMGPGGQVMLTEPLPEFIKDIVAPGVTQIILGDDPADPGQALLHAAYRSRDDYAFRLLLADGVVSRQWRAQVVGLFEVFDQANGVVRLQADLQFTSHVWRSEGA